MAGTWQWVQASEEYAKAVVNHAFTIVEQDPRVEQVLVCTSMQGGVRVSVHYKVEGRYLGLEQVQSALGRQDFTPVQQADFHVGAITRAMEARAVFGREDVAPSRFVNSYTTATDNVETFYTYDDLTCGRLLDPARLMDEWVERLRTTGETAAKPFVP